MKITSTQRKLLAETALGKRKADTVITNGTIVNVHSKELTKKKDIAITSGAVAYIGNCRHLIGEDTNVINANGKFVTPGLIDGHMHVESTMLSVTEFAKAALKQGTTSIFMDPHEIANVFGLEGVRWMHEEGQNLPLRVFTTVPSCVPAADTLEDAGAELIPDDIEKALKWDNVAGLGEVMNFPGVVNGDEKMAQEIESTIHAAKTVTGHIPAEDPGMLQAYVASGVTSCHETVTRQQALEKLRLGMHVMIREGSAWQDVEQLAPIVTKDHMPSENLSLVTDDVYPQTLTELGHLNYVVRKAVREGIDPITAIQMATINAANYFNYGDTLGSIAPGKWADLLFVDNLEDMKPTTVITGGEVVYDNGKYHASFPVYTYPEQAKDSVHLERTLLSEDFHAISNSSSETTVHVIEALENNARTSKAKAVLKVKENVIQPDLEKDIIHLSCVDRHHSSGQISNAFVKGFHIQRGAVASTVAHDSHNLLVMGVDKTDMAVAANRLAELGGGMIVVNNGKVLAEVPLPIAGLMSDQPLNIVNTQVKALDQAWKELGCRMNAPFMTFSLIALPVIPSIRITNRGIADVDKFELITLELQNK
ncbi:adenine deaminase [Halobacillus sp. A5]|uniref:adenine deaminase n=1 Tax=Halobacillus sp. A5 TaxID=2880263 RepID=UPI0020A665B2|nr:adenine deaminase [Halobacillus sp. A5]MCP3027996.1 adenine deaminase [Halobacillus sp. A5]